MSATNDQGKKKTTSAKSKSQSKPQKNQVSLAGVAKSSDKKKKEDKKSLVWLKWVIIGIVALLCVLGAILLYLAFFGGEGSEQAKKPALTAREMIEYTYTPDELAGDVSYYLMGVTGAEIGDPMDMLAVMCYDRKAGEVSVMQIPVDTYIDKENGFAVDTIGNVWYNPQPEIFCSACRERVPEEERDGQIHATCGAELEEHTGSATGDLIRVINDQYGLPIDNYFIVSREGLADFIDGFGGVKVDLSEAMTLDGRLYDSGVHTLDGHMAVEYAVTYDYDGKPTSDRERMLRQRQVFASLWERMAAQTAEDLFFVDDLGANKGILGKLMNGDSSIRFNTTSFGRARLLGVEDKEAEDIVANEALSRFVQALGDVPLKKVTFSILPGTETIQGTTRMYSVNRKQTIELLNELMNPYDLTIDEETVTAPQMNETEAEVDNAVATLDTALAMKAVEEPAEGEE